jgi:mannose-6-phosphate isomerase-like protein (cupin superfamily)
MERKKQEVTTVKVSKMSAEHYIWGQVCDGWHLVKTGELSIIHERMPAKTSEARHFHQKARQFFFVLAGHATIEVDGKIILLGEHEGVEVDPGVPHQMMNPSPEAIEFIVVSSPASHGDRIAVE